MKVISTVLQNEMTYCFHCSKVFSFDKDPKRLATMNTLTLKAGVLNAMLTHADFLKVKTDDPQYAKVKYFIVDPSCSGSGRLQTTTVQLRSL